MSTVSLNSIQSMILNFRILFVNKESICAMIEHLLKFETNVMVAHWLAD